MAETYDVIVVGGGPAGYPAAIRCARKGKKVCLIEKEDIGGVCLNRGCIPTKSLVHLAHRASAGNFRGVSGQVSFVWKKVLASIREDVVMRLRVGVGYLLKQNGVSVVSGDAKLDGRLVRVSGRELEASRVILASGSSPQVPAVFRGDARVLTSDDLWTLEELPESIAIVGGGVIGCEFACALANFGVKISLYEMCDRLLPFADREIVKLVQAQMEKRGIQVCAGTCVRSLEEIPEDSILVAAGRTPNLDAIAEGGPAVESGAVVTDGQMRTSTEGVYAAGDINGKYPYAYVATREGEVAADNACGASRTMDYSAIPYAVFSDPEVGCCGLTEEEAKEKGLAVRIGRFPARALGRAHAEGRIEGLFKVIADAGSDRVLGIHVVGERATELVAFSTLAVRKGMTAKELQELLYCHPTFSEGIMEAASDVHGESVHLPPRKA